MAKITLIIWLLIPAALAKCSSTSAKQFFSKSVNAFAIDLVEKLSQNTDNHFIASTLSPWTLLAYTSLGAEGTSLEELNSILRLHTQKGCLKKFFEITKKIYSSNVATNLEGISAIFVNKNMPVIGKFRRQVKEAGVSVVQEISVENYKEVAATINNYVKSATNGTIDKIVEASDLADVVMMIVDILLFKAAWKIPFPSEKTKESPFYDELYNEIGQVNLMTLTDFFNACNMDDINATVVELPYSDNKFSMYLFVPYKNVKLSHVVSALKTISLRRAMDCLKKAEIQEVTVSLPRFKMSSNISNFKEILMLMGLMAIFDSSQASFTNISHHSLYISNLIQKAVVEVNEKGTIASAATEAEFSFKSFPLTVIANKPFFFTIVDKKTLIPVFAGAYSKPSVY